MKTFLKVLVVLTLLIAPPALPQAHVIADRAYTVNTGTSVVETIACNAGVSPCTIGAVSTTVLNANPVRHECLLQNANTTDFYCLKGAGTASTANMSFILKAATAANKGDGGTYSCNSGPVLWTGVIICISSAAGGTLNVTAD